MSLQTQNPPTDILEMVTPPPAPPAPPVPPVPPDGRLDDLAQIIAAYNQVTEKLQQSHEALQTEVLRLRQELASTNAQLQRSKRLSALGEMAAGIAHEIRNPLAAIQLYAALVVDDLQTDNVLKRQEAIGNTDKIAVAVRGLNSIVCDVLSFAREIEPEAQLLSVVDVFNRAIEAHYPAIDQAEVTVERMDLGKCELSIYADPHMLHQGLLNLLRNAVDAMAGRPDPRILTTRAWADNGVVTLTVGDTGPGIDEADVDRIFNPFFTTRDTGTGLGLAIVHRIIDAHGGTIAVNNVMSEGGGTGGTGGTGGGGVVFALSLPGCPEQHDLAGASLSREGSVTAATELSTPGAAA